MKCNIFLLWTLMGILSSHAQAPIKVMRVNKQKTFAKTIPAGNYSGITYLGNNLYAVVSDKSPKNGFSVFKITVDQKTGQVVSAIDLGFTGTEEANGDLEAIAAVHKNSFFISSETDNSICEYDSIGQKTGRQLAIPAVYQRATSNYGLESLSYNPITKTFWTANESTLKGDGAQANATNGIQNKIRITAFGEDLLPKAQYYYLMDKPEAKRKAWLYGNGVVELTALDDGSLLVLEREFYTPKKKVGAFVTNKLFHVEQQSAVDVSNIDSLNNAITPLHKQLLWRWRTHLNVLKQNIANFEGMCLGPKLPNGTQVLILVSDSQNQAGGVMKDWFKTILLPANHS